MRATPVYSKRLAVFWSLKWKRVTSERRARRGAQCILVKIELLTQTADCCALSSLVGVLPILNQFIYFYSAIPATLLWFLYYFFFFFSLTLSLSLFFSLFLRRAEYYYSKSIIHVIDSIFFFSSFTEYLRSHDYRTVHYYVRRISFFFFLLFLPVIILMHFVYKNAFYI